jgi:hypothetical protein
VKLLEEARRRGEQESARLSETGELERDGWKLSDVLLGVALVLIAPAGVGAFIPPLAQSPWPDVAALLGLGAFCWSVVASLREPSPEAVEKALYRHRKRQELAAELRAAWAAYRMGTSPLCPFIGHYLAERFGDREAAAREEAHLRHDVDAFVDLMLAGWPLRWERWSEQVGLVRAEEERTGNRSQALEHALERELEDLELNLVAEAARRERYEKLAAQHGLSAAHIEEVGERMRLRHERRRAV